MTQCHLCPGLEALAARRGCERIIIQGWRCDEGWRWIVDVITDEAAGHGNEKTPDASMNEAIRQTADTSPLANAAAAQCGAWHGAVE